MILLAELTEIQDAVSKHFREGGEWLSFIAVLLTIAVVFVIVAYLSRRQERAQSNVVPSDPQRLFRDLIAKLELTIPQQGLLQKIAKDLEITHPSILLLSPAILTTHVAQWHNQVGSSAKSDGKIDQNQLEELYDALFPKHATPS